MTTLWPLIEPLLPGVTKPARYIGGERARSAGPRPRAGPLAARLPRHLRDRAAQPGPADPLRDPERARPTRVAERTYAPWMDMEAAMRAAGVPLFSRGEPPAAGDFDVLAFNLSAELVYTNVLNLLDLAGVAGPRGRARPDATRSWWPAGTAPSTPSRWPTSSTPSCSATARRSWARSPRSSGRGRAPPDARRRRACSWRARAHRGGLRARPVRRRRYDGRPGRSATTPADGAPAVVEKRTVADLADWPYPQSPARAADRGGPRPAQRRGVPGLHPGLPVLPGRDDHPTGARAPGGAGRARWCSDGLERTGYDEVALTSLSTRRLLGHRGDRRADHGGPGRRRAGVGQPARACGSTPSPWGPPAQIQQVRRTGLTFAPEGGTWRMRQVINKLITEEDLYAAVDAAFSQGWRRVKLYFLIGLPTETDEDVTGDRRARPALRGDRPALPPRGDRDGLGRRVRAQAPHAVPVVRPGHARGAAPQGRPAARRGAAGCAGCRSAGTTPRRPPPRASPAAATGGSAAVIERVWRAGGTFQEWSERFDLAAVDRGAGRRGALARRHRPPRPRPRRGARLGPHLGRPAPRLPLGRLAGRPWPPPGSRTAGGRPATTAGPAPASASSTWWPRRSPRRAGARAPARTWPGGCRSPSATARGARRSMSEGDADPRPGAVLASKRARSGSPPSATWPGCGSGRCAARRSRWPGPRGSRPARC